MVALEQTHELGGRNPVEVLVATLRNLLVTYRVFEFKFLHCSNFAYERLTEDSDIGCGSPGRHSAPDMRILVILLHSLVGLESNYSRLITKV